MTTRFGNYEALAWVVGAVGLIGPWAFLAPTKIALFPGTDAGRILAWLTAVVALWGLLIIVGLGQKGQVFGALIDQRNRYSLARLQVTLWTGVILSAVYTSLVAAVLRVGSLAQVTIDWNLISLLGLSVASFVAAPIALNVKTKQAHSSEDLDYANEEVKSTQNVQHDIYAIGNVIAKEYPTDARFGDLFRGEDVGNAGEIDLARFQMLAITTFVVITYAALVFLEFGKWESALSVPVFPQTLLGLVMVSHAGYLGGKLIPNTPVVSEAASSRVAKSSHLNLQASNLSRDIGARLSRDDLAPTSKEQLTQLLALTNLSVAEAARLLGSAASVDFADDDLARLEGQLIGLRTSFRSLSSDATMPELLSAPSSEIVLEIQRTLSARGYAVVAHGIPDKPTLDAIQRELVARSVPREALHSAPFRYFEEVLEVLGAR